MSRRNTAKKYLENGAISPLWAEIELRNQEDEHEIQHAVEMERALNQVRCTGNPNVGQIIVDVMTGLQPLFRNLAEEQRHKQSDTSDVIIETRERQTSQILEDKFEFLKKHSGTPEDLELAKFVLETEGL